MDDLIKGVWPFMLAELIVLALLVAFPALVTRAGILDALSEHAPTMPRRAQPSLRTDTSR